MKKYLVAALAVLIALILGTGIGRYTAPKKVVTIDKTQELQMEFVENTRKQIAATYEKKLEEMKKHYLAEQNKSIKRSIRIEKKPDGTVLVTKDETENTTSKTDIKTDVTTGVITVNTVTTDIKEKKDKVLEKSEEHIKQVEYKKPNLRIGAMFGLDVNYLKEVVEKRSFDSPGSAGLMFGGMVEKRLGPTPLFLGVWGNSRGQVGLGVSWEFD